MTTKLTLSVDPAVITRAKRYAKHQGVSVSAMVETYLAAVSQPVDSAKPPQVRGRLQGVLKRADTAAYRRHLERKYKGFRTAGLPVLTPEAAAPLLADR